jgi:hypothetical protein
MGNFYLYSIYYQTSNSFKSTCQGFSFSFWLRTASLSFNLPNKCCLFFLMKIIQLFISFFFRLIICVEFWHEKKLPHRRRRHRRRKLGLLFR